MKNSQFVLSVKFTSTLLPEVLQNACQKGLNSFSEVPGLLRKYYLAEEDTGAISGFYVFESKQARDSFWDSDFAKTIPSTYGVKLDTLRVEKYEISILLDVSGQLNS